MSRHLRDGNGVVADGGRLENSRVLSRGTVRSIKLHSSVCVLSIHASYGPIFAIIVRSGLSCLFYGRRWQMRSEAEVWGLALGVEGSVDGLLRAS